MKRKGVCFDIFLFLFDRNNQAGAALACSSLEHGPAVLGAHPGTKPVHLYRAALLRLVCTLWHSEILDASKTESFRFLGTRPPVRRTFQYASRADSPINENPTIFQASKRITSYPQIINTLYGILGAIHTLAGLWISEL